MDTRRANRNTDASAKAWQSIHGERSPYAYFNRVTDEDDDGDGPDFGMMMARVRPSGMDAGGLMPRVQSAASLKFDEQAELAEDVLVGATSGRYDYINEGEEGKWIRYEVKCRECRWFVPAEDSSDDEEYLQFSKNAPVVKSSAPAKDSTDGLHVNTDRTKSKRKRSVGGGEDRKCACGSRLSEHRDPQRAVLQGKNSPSNNWDASTHTSPIPTDAFGEIEFVGYGDKVAKYIRVDYQTEMSLMTQLMTEKWKMERPNLLISVTGGAKNFLMRGRLKDAFRRGLMKAALSTGAWIMTGGNNTGVMKHVGEAVRDYGLTAEGRVIAIGIAPWGCVQNKEVLIDDRAKGKWPAMYRIEMEQKPKESFLDPNHTHFILVDNGTKRQFTTEIEFRAKLEKEISKWTTGGSDVRVPVALLVLEGGPGTLKTVMNAIKNNTPTIVISGSGKCADVLAHAAQNITKKEVQGIDNKGQPYTETMGEMDDKLKAEIKTMVEQTFGVKESVQRADWVEKCMAKPNLLTVFELESVSGSASSGVDLAILKALLKANKDEVMDQLKLALAWNRIDIAKSEIFTDERPWPTGELDDMMMSAIQLNRVDFVDLFLDNGVSLKDFLTIRRLLNLYNQIPKNCLLYTLLNKVKSSQPNQQLQDGRKCFSLDDVGILLQDLLGDYYQPDYLLDDTLCELKADVILKTGASSSPAGNKKMMRPAQDLFLWAVLMNQQDLAKLFWREGNESTAAALVANSILKAMRRYTNDSDMIQRLTNNADEFEDLSIGVINNCYFLDEPKAQDVLIREMNNWGKATCVLIAVQADNKRFISQTACQSLLNSIWMGKLSQENGLIRLLLSMFFFPFILVLIKFKDEELQPLDTYNPSQSKKSEVRPALKREMTQANLSKEPTQTSMKGERKRNGLSNCEKIMAFYTAPVVIFILNCVSYLVFLGLYSYILVVQLSTTFHFLEGILIVWVFTIFVEEIRQLVTNYAHSVKSKVIAYITDSWNILDIITIVLFSVGMTLRFIPNDSCMEAARIVLALNIVSFFFRILHIFSVNKELGPKLVMIRRMIRDLLWFVVILLVFIGAYAIASEAILFPETELSWKLLYHLPRKAYWQIFGEQFLSVVEGEDTCTNDPALYNGYGHQRCPSETGKYLVPFLMALYVMMTDVLLLNLLIAMFSYTFQKVQDHTDTHWYFQRFNLIHEYYERPWLPPPFILFIHLYMMFTWCVRQCTKTTTSSDFRKRFQNQQDEKQLVQWENIIADTYLTRMEAKGANSVDGKLKLMMQRLETIQQKLDSIPDGTVAGGVVGATQTPASAPVVQTQPLKQVIQMPPQLEQRLGSLEEQIAKTSQALTWIMQTMKAEGEGKNPPQLLSGHEDYKEAERQEARKRKASLKDQVKKQIEKKLLLHVVSRSPVYPNSFVGRYPVPDEKVSWDVEFEDYDPVPYTADSILAKPPYADTLDLLAMPVKERVGKIPFNDIDKDNKVSRVSYEGTYKVVDGLPLNPVGRTGLEGRGLLGRWGPNIAGDPLVTRWKSTPRQGRLMVDGKPVLEFIAVKRMDNRMWALPGAITLPGEQAWDVLFKYFKMEALGSLMDDPNKKAEIDRKVQELSQKGVTLYQGYADDARNTDNAWLETSVMNFHDDTGEILDNFELRAGVGTQAVSWLTVSSKRNLHGSHLYFLKLAAEHHGAAF